MGEPKANENQQLLIDAMDGIVLADAGPGTGKTFTISLRYDNLLRYKDLDPEDILLITFTNNAAENMKERIISICQRDSSSLRDAPICTFHSLCFSLLSQHGILAPFYLGISEHISSSTRILENSIMEKGEFRNFMQGFIVEHPEYNDFFRILGDHTDLLYLITSLCAKGIFPKRKGWYRNSDKYLDGDFDAFFKIFKELNTPVQGEKSSKQSKLRESLNSYGSRNYIPGAPSIEELRGARGTKSIDDKWAFKVFTENRDQLKSFIHDVYFQYI